MYEQFWIENLKQTMTQCIVQLRRKVWFLSLFPIIMFEGKSASHGHRCLGQAEHSWRLHVQWQTCHRCQARHSNFRSPAGSELLPLQHQQSVPDVLDLLDLKLLLVIQRRGHTTKNGTQVVAKLGEGGSWQGWRMCGQHDGCAAGHPSQRWQIHTPCPHSGCICSSRRWGGWLLADGASARTGPSLETGKHNSMQSPCRHQPS